MSESTKWDWADLEPLELELDPYNPRLPRAFRGASQRELIEVLVVRFDTESLAQAIVTAGYLEQDPIAGFRVNSGVRVREGNRRVAAAKLLLEPKLAPERYQPRFAALAQRLGGDVRRELERLRVQVWHDPNDPELNAYIGYRHVTGVRAWPPVEKANFIAGLVDEQGLTYGQVAEQIGSKPRHVERHYLAYKVVEQALAAEVAGAEDMEESFGVLLRALQAKGVPDFLGIRYTGDPKDAQKPVPEDHAERLVEFVRWTFGTEEHAKVLIDSRNLTRWARILASDEALEYLRRTKEPDFERAWERSGGEAETLADALYVAADHLRDAVAIIADHQDDADVVAAMRECSRFFRRIERQAPGLVGDMEGAQ